MGAQGRLFRSQATTHVDAVRDVARWRPGMVELVCIETRRRESKACCKVDATRNGFAGQCCFKKMGIRVSPCLTYNPMDLHVVGVSVAPGWVVSDEYVTPIGHHDVRDLFSDVCDRLSGESVEMVCRESRIGIAQGLNVLDSQDFG